MSNTLYPRDPGADFVGYSRIEERVICIKNTLTPPSPALGALLNRKNLTDKGD
jgi:hypothetical protein